MCGQGRSGKTATREALLGHAYQETDSTIGVDQALIQVDINSLQTAASGQWTHVVESPEGPSALDEAHARLVVESISSETGEGPVAGDATGQSEEAKGGERAVGKNSRSPESKGSGAAKEGRGREQQSINTVIDKYLAAPRTKASTDSADDGKTAMDKGKGKTKDIIDEEAALPAGKKDTTRAPTKVSTTVQLCLPLERGVPLDLSLTQQEEVPAVSKIVPDLVLKFVENKEEQPLKISLWDFGETEQAPSQTNPQPPTLDFHKKRHLQALHAELHNQVDRKCFILWYGPQL